MTDSSPPVVHFSLRVKGEPLAWYDADGFQDAARHANAIVSHPEAQGAVEVVLVDPSAGDILLLLVSPKQ
jgi:hypothetical protein